VRVVVLGRRYSTPAGGRCAHWRRGEPRAGGVTCSSAKGRHVVVQEECNYRRFPSHMAGILWKKGTIKYVISVTF
jgi:hypothetical protein